MSSDGSSAGNTTAWPWSWQITPYSDQIKKGRYAFTLCKRTNIFYFYPLTIGVKSVGLLWQMLLEGNSFRTSDMSDSDTWNLKKQTNIILNNFDFQFILLSSMSIYFFKTQLTASYVSNKFWKLHLLVKKTYHGGKYTFCLTLAGPCAIIQFKQINQPDATVLQVYYLTFCFAQHVSGASTPIISSLLLH